MKPKQTLNKPPFPPAASSYLISQTTLVKQKIQIPHFAMDTPTNVKINQPSASTMSLDPAEIQKQDLKKVEEEQVLRLRGGTLGYSNPLFSLVDVPGALAMSAAAAATGAIPGTVAAVNLRLYSPFFRIVTDNFPGRPFRILSERSSF